MSQSINQDEWRDAYLAEIDRIGALTQDRILNTVFFGGGTPSLMPAETVAAILERVRKTWRSANDLEITLEANPTSVEASKFAAFERAGVNRVSMGIQSLNNHDLRKLGRMHTVEEALDAFNIARASFDRLSFDLIYARQDQSISDWEKELTTALSYASDHLSLYQLTIEQGTNFGDRYNRGLLAGLPDEDSAADMYFVTQDICDAHGFRAYEISNHSRPGNEAKHNLIYWNYGDYAGIGPGAHGRLTLNGQKIATETRLNPNAWLTARSNGTHETKTVLTREDQSEEMLLMGLRTIYGVSLKRFNSLANTPLNMETIEDLATMDLVMLNQDRLTVTRQGRPVLNAILAKLLSD